MRIIRETWVLFIHYEKLLIRNPFWILAALFQPICYLYLFAPLLKNVVGVTGDGKVSSINMFTPGLLVMVSLFGVMFVGFGMIDYMRSGVIERLRVTTASRLALLLGLVIRDVVTLIAQTIIVILLALPLGLSISPLGIILTLFIMILIGLCMAPVSYALALTVKSEDALGPILNFFSQPLLLLSGVLLPLTLAPAWLKNISMFNPLKYVVDASRAIFNGDISNAVVWHAYVLLVGLVILSFWWGLSCMKKATE
ncbi:ABC-2 type transporter [Candidatus Desulfosporosinus infrequens]|uniref:Transport permease protein n=1 Tax=Candidatus Desulfosporosinus infrequens TaxID=2043169 RepID=A0A2U3LA72_9FIRM|nr:ABC-2 type transporter [Candidatus Desulfosporosinus infrequens]